ncbi:HipA-like protein [Lyngbya confervoides]|uniref:HipA-like protein n=1 Tax=Lyngbya confervoides BDU141951 TaxID=1574623 RepID=A0ABD4T1Y8_9CYAN|nr:HipA-like protein [Lyngbya confervoides]MCM1982776.1 hypothetical protein [Lyngbya confervoides BDU141951]
MLEPFPIIQVAKEAAEAYEEVGTKAKFWFYDEQRGRCLFKKARPNTGEDWSEKVAAELAKMLGLPHASYELATSDGERGTVSPSFIPAGGELSLGNELLSPTIPGYPQTEDSPSQHTVAQVFSILKDSTLELPYGWDVLANITEAPHVFVGYLLLDAWIGNTDRHHENWGVIKLESLTYLAPTYDHASSLGRNLPDSERYGRFKTTDQGFTVQAFVMKGKSCLYRRTTDNRPLKVHAAFLEAAAESC